MIVSINSFRRGVGRSNITANLAALLALAGQRVGMIDANLQSPSLHILFNQDETEITASLNDYLWGKCNIMQTVREVTPPMGVDIPGGLFLVPASTKIGEVTQMVRQGYDVNLLDAGIRHLIEALSLDVVLIDTQHGLNEETLYSIAISDALVLLLRTDRQDYRGTGITVQVARKFEVSRLMLVVNEAPAFLDFAALKLEVEQTYNSEVAAVLPHFDELMSLGSAKIFVLHYPDHPLTATLKEVANKLVT
jgi:MinD-like ATPase involved in chromosome partitioning or flagellar assembly